VNIYVGQKYTQLLSNANYITKMQPSQKGIIGITLLSHWYEPASKEKADIDAAHRGLDFMFGW
jgi:hypothetical protein